MRTESSGNSYDYDDKYDLSNMLSDAHYINKEKNCASEKPETPEEAKINDRSANDITIFILISAFVGFIAYYCFS